MCISRTYGVIGSAVLLVSACGTTLFLSGCEVVVRGPHAEVVAPSVEVQGPLIVGEGVVAVDVEPPPDECVYQFELGFPPGCFFWHDHYYFGGYCYTRDVFLNRVVHENILHHRYVNVEENRRAAASFQTRDRERFTKTGGRVDSKELERRRGNVNKPMVPHAEEKHEGERHEGVREGGEGREREK